MKASELRIGNIIKQGAINHLEVTSYGIEYVQCDCGYVDTPEPEILTEEWLRKFGFAFTTQYECRLADFRLMQNEDGEWNLWTNTVNIADESHAESIGMACKYVHQLQNLYFALTGEELTS